jgi:hypothetical protein
MILRWVLVGVLEAARGFRRLKGYKGYKGYKGMKVLVARLRQHGESAAEPDVDAKRPAA